MSSARLSYRERQAQRRADHVPTLAEREQQAADGRRSQAELIDQAEAAGAITHEQAEDLRNKYGDVTNG